MYCGGSSITSCPWARNMGAQHPRPVMRRAAGLQPDPGRRQLGKERFHLLAAKPATQHRLLLFVDTVQLKDMLGGIQANSDNTHRTAPLLELHQSQPGTFDAVGGRPPQQGNRQSACPGCF
jgi:hypothetical protein